MGPSNEAITRILRVVRDFWTRAAGRAPNRLSPYFGPEKALHFPNAHCIVKKRRVLKGVAVPLNCWQHTRRQHPLGRTLVRQWVTASVKSCLQDQKNSHDA
jgi:hypothetical protein